MSSPDPQYPPLSPQRDFSESGMPQSPTSPNLFALAQRRRSMLHRVMSSPDATNPGGFGDVSAPVTPALPTHNTGTYFPPTPLEGTSSNNSSGNEERNPTLAFIPHHERRAIAAKRWEPTHLKTAYLLLNVVGCVAIAIALEVLLRVNKNAFGWRIPSVYAKHPQIHLLWTFLPGVLAFLVVREWNEIDRYIKVLQPYVDMSSSRVPAEKSVLLNYEDQSKWTVWLQALRNKHTTAVITNTICLLAVAVSPLFSSYIYLQQPSNDFTQPLSNISVLQELGLQANPSFEVTDAAAGFMKASSKYDVDSPPYIRFLPAASWTSVEVSVPKLHEAGIIKAQTVCLKTLVSCTAISNLAYDTQTTTIKGSTSNCSFSTDASQSLGWSASIPFGVTPASCSSSMDTTENAAVAFWVLGEAISGGGFGSSAAVAAVCTPTVQVQRAEGFFNSSTNSLLLVNGQTPLTDGDKTSVNLNAAPFNGSAYNGLFFDNVTTVADEINLNSTVFGLGQAIASLFQKNDTTLTSASAFEAVVSDAYAHYLGLIVPALYYKNLDGVFTNGVIHPTDQRLFISTPVTHVLFVLLILIALGGLVVVFLHRRAARHLILTSEPGTLAAAIALAGHSDMSQMLKGYDTEEEMRAMLADLRFTIDPATHQLIVEEDEMGYGELPKRFVPRTPMDPMSPSTWVPTTYEDKA